MPPEEINRSSLDATVIVRLEEAIRQFEEAWAQGRRPSIEACLPLDPPLRAELLPELIHAEMEFRLKAREDARVEHYLERFPELRSRPGAVLDLVLRESALRGRTGQIISLEEYLRRFPEFREELLRRLPQADPPVRLALRLNCPHCRNPIELIHDGREDLLCPACGSTFRLDAAGTQTWSPQRLPQLGRFQLLEAVGRGSFGTVYRARDTQLDRIVAVKVPRSGRLATKEDEDRFVREGRNAARLQHPGIVPVYEVGQGDAVPYIVSEFVDGVTLADMLTSRRLSFRETADTLWQAASALEHAHSQGVVHRDLKPTNLLLQTSGNLDSQAHGSAGSGSTVTGSGSSRNTPAREAPWRVRIMDFGLARRDEGELTVTMEGQLLGTPAYMSPEQARGDNKSVGRSSDIYSLGVVLYELLTGELPFRGNQRMLLHQVLYDEPRSPRQLNDRIPRDLETICLRSMSKEPARRYASAADLAGDLVRWLSGEPIVSRPIGALERGWRWCRRNRAKSLAAGSLLVAVIAIVSTLSVSLIKIRESAEAERRAKQIAQALAAEEARQRALAEQARQDAEADRQAAVQAREREAEQRREAQQSQQNAVATTAFLVNVFESSDPLGLKSLGFRQPQGDGQPLTAREILDRGRQRVETELAAQPLVQATVLDALGTAYLGQGDFELAATLMDRAWDIRKTRLPADHIDVLASLHNRAFLKIIRSEMPEAEELLNQVLAAQQKMPDCPPLTLARTKFHLGFVMNETYRAQEAEQMFRQALTIREKHLGPDHQDTLLARLLLVATLLGQNREHEVGVAEGLKLAQGMSPQHGVTFAMWLFKYYQLNKLRHEGDFAGAAAGNRPLRAAAVELLGEEHPIVIALDFDYAGLQQKQGNYLEAQSVGQQTLARLPRVIANNPRVAEPHFKLGQWLLQLGDYRAAEEHLRAAMRVAGLVQVKEHMWGLEASLELARLQQRRGNLAAAEEQYRQVLAQTAPTDSNVRVWRDTPRAMHDAATISLIYLMLERNRPAEAVELARPFYERSWKARNENAMPAIAMSQLLSLCLREQGDYTALRRLDSERAELVNQLLSKVEAGLGGPESLHLASLLQEQGDLKSAERLVRIALDTARKVHPAQHPDLAGNLFVVGVFLRDAGSVAEGRQLLEEALLIRHEKLGARHRDTINTQLALATAEQRLMQSEAAIDRARSAVGSLEAALGEGTLETGPAIESLANLLVAGEQIEEAELLLRKRLQILRQHLPADHGDVAEARVQLAELILRRDATAGAALLIEARDRLAAAVPKNSWRLAEIASRLATFESAEGNTVVEAKLRESWQTLEAAFGPKHERALKAAERLARHQQRPASN